MNVGRRLLIISLVLLGAISSFGYLFWYKPEYNKHPSRKNFSNNLNVLSGSNEVLSKLKIKAALAKDYIYQHAYSRSYCFLLDMRIPSGKKRFFVYNLNKDSVELAGLVTHGSGSQQTDSDELLFSNESNSYCTSLGKYKVGKSYTGTFGLAYKLCGLDETNDNAFNRCVVLHSHNCVPAEEVFPSTICLSLGCPTVSPPFLTKLREYIDNAAQPMLLWIYY